MAALSERVFRKAALERLSSPEKLDQLVSLTSPVGWLAAAALSALMVAALVWSFIGVIPTAVYGSGIMVTRGGHVFDAMAPFAGSLVSVADVGTVVKKGDILAILDDTQLREDIDHAEEVMHEKQADLQNLSQNFDQQIALKRKNTVAQRENFSRIIAAAERRRAFYAGLLERQAKMVDKGFLTERFQEETRRSLEEAEEEGRRAKSDLLRLDADEADLTGRRDLAVLQAGQVVNDARRRTDELKIQLEQATRVKSPLDGVVTELKATPGTVVAPGKPILSIETAGTGLELLLYVPPEYGKKVAPGMEVRIEPATLKKEEYGTLIGRVVAVSDFPMTAEGMSSVLQNAQLVTSFMEQGPPYAVRVEILRAPDTISGYVWSGGSGPPIRLTSGTTVRAAVTISRRTPISFLIPLLKERTGFAS